VLHAAIANALGSKSLMFSKYEAYKTVKVKEMNLAGEILTSLAEKVKSKKADVEEHVFKHANIYANALKQYLSMKLALKTWIRYAVINYLDTRIYLTNVPRMKWISTQMISSWKSSRVTRMRIT
jgi:hypothetical protein